MLANPGAQVGAEGDRGQAAEEPPHVGEHRGDARAAQQLAVQGRTMVLERVVPVTEQLPQAAGERLL
ncbi:hypothetical protein [Micromonospora globbae]|uniref:hypothetical protein n=1 Tax=Micromonospora globbae TaxID=1894969 RepID=UPI00341F2801